MSTKLPRPGMLLKRFRRPAPAGETGGITWDGDAQRRLARIPSFVRPMARKRIEQFARENGHDTVTLEVYQQARQNFGM